MSHLLLVPKITHFKSSLVELAATVYEFFCSPESADITKQRCAYTCWFDFLTFLKVPPPLPPPFSGKSWIKQYKLFREKRKELGCPSFLWVLAYPSVQIPCFLLGTTSVRQMALDYHSGLETGGTLWFENLTELSHGSSGYIFPLLLTSLHLVNVKVSFGKSSLTMLPNIFGVLAKNLFLYGYGAKFNFLGILGIVVIKDPESFDILQGHSKATMFLLIIMMGEELVGLMGEQLAKPATSCATENGVSFLEQVFEISLFLPKENGTSWFDFRNTMLQSEVCHFYSRNRTRSGGYLRISFTLTSAILELLVEKDANSGTTEENTLNSIVDLQASFQATTGTVEDNKTLHSNVDPQASFQEKKPLKDDEDHDAMSDDDGFDQSITASSLGRLHPQSVKYDPPPSLLFSTNEEGVMLLPRRNHQQSSSPLFSSLILFVILYLLPQHPSTNHIAPAATLIPPTPPHNSRIVTLLRSFSPIYELRFNLRLYRSPLCLLL
ncbi:hypothetical protein L2E82_49767 [Cichorium intybus]|uniref:Uncharacterized protein n=1 Tax=Cichorium intybus TaxID=13427 RepID=A0ACB8Z198_CICIN|nr:hypothetical protein L2E82_49767 [Cichorium intybus]